MGYKKAADGVASKGKTRVEIFPNDGKTAPNPRGGKGKGGVTGKAMRAVGRNMARANNQRGG
jgi:hypothetical protein